MNFNILLKYKYYFEIVNRKIAGFLNTIVKKLSFYNECENRYDLLNKIVLVLEGTLCS
ncbi:hypothetical protein BACCIP111895_01398 [Neobacillus rhizosphaerae]|uniref:Transposase n=1 Tax=Neobacillus rhizosphaerae TaxID=2880965 RepID=A0ABM9ENS5_9BACI|nr:hypothetical protein BACCIP111895_01398 [Neobacillus rhizosphaerae]